MKPIFFINEQKQIIVLDDGEFTFAGEKCNSTANMRCLGGAPTADSLGYKIGQLFRTQKTSRFYEKGSVWELHSYTDSQAPQFSYVSGEKSLNHDNSLYIAMHNIVPLTEKECQAGSSRYRAGSSRYRAESRLRAAITAARPEALVNLPSVMFDRYSADGTEGPHSLLQRAFVWGETGQGSTYWHDLQGTLAKAQLDRDRVVKLLKEAGREDAAKRLPEFIAPFEKLAGWAGSFKWGDAPLFWRCASNDVALYLESKNRKNVTMTGRYKTKDGRDVRILCIDRPADQYPVVGLLGDTVMTFTKDGKYRARYGSNYDDLVEVENTFHKDQKVDVSDDGVYWQKRYYSHYQDGYHRTFNDGSCSDETRFTSPWKFCRPAKP